MKEKKMGANRIMKRLIGSLNSFMILLIYSYSPHGISVGRSSRPHRCLPAGRQGEGEGGGEKNKSSTLIY